MTVGIPGTGIGGLFYLLLVVLMPLREAWRTLRGRSSRARWLEVARHVALAAAIVGGFVATGGVILAVLGTSVRFGMLEADGLQLILDAGGAWSQRALAVSLLVLVGVLLGAAGLRVVMPPRRRPREGFDGPSPQPSLRRSRRSGPDLVPPMPSPSPFFRPARVAPGLQIPGTDRRLNQH